MEPGFTLNPILSDGMVFQRDKPLAVWGTAPEGAEVCVELAGGAARTRAEGGRWRVSLPARPAAEGLVLAAYCGGARREVRDVAVGEVWVCAGQSNMEFPLRFDAEAESAIPAANDPGLRFFDVPKKSYVGQENDPGVDFSESGYWRAFTSQDAGFFSAVGAYFGRALRTARGVPVGLVGCNWGGTSASAWLPEQRLERPELEPYLTRYRKAARLIGPAEYRRKFLARQELQAQPEIRRGVEDLMAGRLPEGELAAFARALTPEQAALLALPVGSMDPNRPGGLYRTMLRCTAPFAVRGVLWYQGESDDVQPETYALLFSELVRSWRELWGDALPFLTVQLAPFGHWLSNTGTAFPELRRQQELAAHKIPGVYITSVMDCGEETDIHPKHKRPVGERLALLARGKIYGEPVLCEPPEALAPRWGESAVEIPFRNGEGLHGGVSAACPVLLLDERPAPFEASLRDNMLTLSARGLGSARRAEIRYAWEPYVRAELYNGAGLCAKPFRFVRPQPAEAKRRGPEKQGSAGLGSGKGGVRTAGGLFP